MQSLLIVVVKGLRKQREKHTPLGLFGAFVLTVLICQLLHLGIENIWRVLNLARYFNNDGIADMVYQYRYDPSNNPYFINDKNNLLDPNRVQLEQTVNSLDKKIYRYGPELSQPIINTINICSNNLVDFSDIKVTESGDYISVICGIAFIFSPVFNLGGFGKAMVSIVVLPEEYHWIFASTEDVENFPGYGLQPVEFELKRRSVLEWIDSSNGLIAAGAASYEGILEEEEDRADIRSEEVYALLLNALSEYRIAKSLFKLNLGKYDQGKCNHNFYKSSSYQRPIVIIGIFTENSKNDFISLRKAQQGVNRINDIPPVDDIDFSCYSSFPDLKVEIDLKSKDDLIERV